MVGPGYPLGLATAARQISSPGEPIANEVRKVPVLASPMHAFDQSRGHIVALRAVLGAATLAACGGDHAGASGAGNGGGAGIPAASGGTAGPPAPGAGGSGMGGSSPAGRGAGGAIAGATGGARSEERR